MSTKAEQPELDRKSFRPYLRLARFDHVTKHVFVAPGIILAYVLHGLVNENLLLNVVLGFVCVVCIASANYVINEWLDRDFDRHHPTKSARVSVQVPLNPTYVYGFWILLILIGLGAAAFASNAMLGIACAFALQGIVYNVPPIRSKDRAFLDVLSEAVNNSFRLMIGWAMIDATTLPPGSIIVAYWLGGAFLMAAKRLSEYKEIVASHGKTLLVSYGRSFRNYTETRLLMSCFAYAISSTTLFTVFMIKYRIEYILAIPFLIVLFCTYLSLSLKPQSVAQAPERLFQDRALMIAVSVFVVALVVLSFVNVPYLGSFTQAHYISLSAR